MRYVDPDGRIDWKAEWKYAWRETKQTFNGDCGADFMLEFENDLAVGRYFNAGVHFLDACAEACFDVWFVYRQLKPDNSFPENNPYLYNIVPKNYGIDLYNPKVEQDSYKSFRQSLSRVCFAD